VCSGRPPKGDDVIPIPSFGYGPERHSISQVELAILFFLAEIFLHSSNILGILRFEHSLRLTLWVSNPELDNKLFAISAENGANQKAFKSNDLKASKLGGDPDWTLFKPIFERFAGEF
jgi:hypothetical protein